MMTAARLTSSTVGNNLLTVEATAAPRLSGADRRAQILACARSEFLTRGLAGSRIQDVADAAGVTAALIYKHFDSKDELFQEAVMAPLHDLLEERIAEIRALPVDPDPGAQLEATRAFMRTLLTTLAEAVESIGVVLFAEQRESRSFYAKHLRPLIDAAVEASRVTFPHWPHAFAIDTAMQAAFGMAFWVALDRSMLESDAALDPLADQLAGVLFGGIGIHE
ncbi:MAG: hypothetical protein QOF76_2458 [Solirubrobacteraceae bacterium]|jgi:AcrR family transcriptional regulator|nr:hypothetical protein [Solirubrobacteraceae bacterium]